MTNFLPPMATGSPMPEKQDSLLPPSKVPRFSTPGYVSPSGSRFNLGYPAGNEDKREVRNLDLTLASLGTKQVKSAKFSNINEIFCSDADADLEVDFDDDNSKGNLALVNSQGDDQYFDDNSFNDCHPLTKKPSDPSEHLNSDTEYEDEEDSKESSSSSSLFDDDGKIPSSFNHTFTYHAPRILYNTDGSWSPIRVLTYAAMATHHLPSSSSPRTPLLVDNAHADLIDAYHNYGDETSSDEKGTDYLEEPSDAEAWAKDYYDSNLDDLFTGSEESENDNEEYEGEEEEVSDFDEEEISKTISEADPITFFHDASPYPTPKFARSSPPYSLPPPTPTLAPRTAFEAFLAAFKTSPASPEQAHSKRTPTPGVEVEAENVELLKESNEQNSMIDLTQDDSPLHQDSDAEMIDIRNRPGAISEVSIVIDPSSLESSSSSFCSYCDSNSDNPSPSSPSTSSFFSSSSSSSPFDSSDDDEYDDSAVACWDDDDEQMEAQKEDDVYNKQMPRIEGQDLAKLHDQVELGVSHLLAALPVPDIICSQEVVERVRKRKALKTADDEDDRESESSYGSSKYFSSSEMMMIKKWKTKPPLSYPRFQPAPLLPRPSLSPANILPVALSLPPSALP